MTENTLRLSKMLSQSSSQTSGLDPKASANDMVSKTLPSKKPKKEFQKGDIKSYPLSLPTGKRKKITKNETKNEIIPILKKTVPNTTETNSSKTSAIKEKRTPNNVKKATESRTRSLKRPVDKAAAKREKSLTLPVSLQGKSSQVSSSSKSELSAISRVSSWSASLKSSVRDDISRDYPGSQASGLTTFSNKTQISTVSQRGKKLHLKFWDPKDIHKLKDKPKESEKSKEGNNSLKANKLISLSDSEEEFILKSESLISKSEEEFIPKSESLISKSEEMAIDKTAERSAFLKVFGSLMDINEVSSTETVDRRETEIGYDSQYVPPVDRLSDESDTSEISISSIDENELITVSKNKSQESINISLDLLVESEDEPVQFNPRLVAEDPQHQDISDLMKDKDCKKTSVDFKSRSPDANNKFPLPLMGKIEAFIDDLLNLAAKLAFNPRMRRILDKKKLIDKLTQLSRQHKDVLIKNLALNEITTEYFIRRREFAYVVVDGKHRSIYKKRFMEMIEELDFNLKRERETKIIVDNLLGDLRKREEIAKGWEVEKVQHFEAKVRKSLLKDGFNRLGLVMNDLFRKMNEIRNEVSKSRQKLTSVQSRLATIKNQSEKMEHQGTCVSEYLANQAVIQTLGLKICDRDAELSRLKDRVTYDLHTMAHLKEKEKLSRESLEAMKDKLKLQRQKHQKLRDLLYAEIQRRKHLKKETENARRGSLMHYPAILRDYDATTDYLQTKQKVVQKLRSEYNRLTRKLSKLESCTE